MGIFDYVRLSSDLKHRLGKYGAEDYQTKYVFDGEYVSVYSGFTERAPAWDLLTWVELLVKPGPKAAFMEPLMQTVDIGHIGEAEKATVKADLQACLYSDEVGDVLEALGFKGPKESEETAYDRIREIVGRIALAGEEAVLKVERVKDEDALFGYRTYLSIRSCDTELHVPLSAILEVGGREITAIKEELVERKKEARIWRREHRIGGAEVAERVKVGGGRWTTPHTLEIATEAVVAIDSVSESLINQIKEEVKGIARKILSG